MYISDLVANAPCPSALDHLNRTARNTKFASEGATCRPFCQSIANLVHLFLRQFRHCVLLPDWSPFRVKARRIAVPRGHTSFACRVSRVFCRGAQKQVIWPDAGRVIARMADTQTVGNVATGEYPTEPVRPYFALTNTEQSVSAAHGNIRPNPAAVGDRRLLNLRPESRNIFGSKLIVHLDLQASGAAPGVYPHRPAPSCFSKYSAST